jgi:hypothetical protein
MNILNGFNALSKKEPIRLSTSLSMDEPEEVAAPVQPPVEQKQENVCIVPIATLIFCSLNFPRHKLD